MAVKPYFRQCAPPEFFATLPPMLQTDWEEEPGRKIAVRLNVRGDIEIDDAGFDDDASVGKIEFENAIHAGETDDDTVFDGERAAAGRPVPEPRETKGILWRWQRRRMDWTCAVDVGRRTA